MKATLTVLGAILELEAETDHELWQKVALYQSLPTVCPIDATPTRFAFRSPEGNDYYEIANTNPDYYICCHVGQKKKDKSLYCDGIWSWWDWQKKEEIILAKWDTLTPEGVALQRQMQDGPPATQPEPAKQEPQPTKQEPQPTKQPVNLDKAKVSPELLKARHTFHAMGRTLYGEEWDATRAKACKARGLASSNDASIETMNEMISNLEVNLRNECRAQAELNGWLGETLSNLCEEMQHGAYRINDVRGVALTNLLRELRLPCKLSEEELAF